MHQVIIAAVTLIVLTAASSTLALRSQARSVAPSVAQKGSGGAFFPADLTTIQLRDQVIALVARHRLPAIYTDRAFVTGGGLMSYDADRLEIYRRTASYIDRILRGERPGELPFQQPTKYQLTINVKTAKALGIGVPATLLAIADEVME